MSSTDIGAAIRDRLADEPPLKQFRMYSADGRVVEIFADAGYCRVTRVMPVKNGDGRAQQAENGGCKVLENAEQYDYTHNASNDYQKVYVQKETSIR